MDIRPSRAFTYLYHSGENDQLKYDNSLLNDFNLSHSIVKPTKEISIECKSSKQQCHSVFTENSTNMVEDICDLRIQTCDVLLNDFSNFFRK